MLVCWYQPDMLLQQPNSIEHPPVELFVWCWPTLHPAGQIASLRDCSVQPARPGISALVAQSLAVGAAASAKGLVHRLCWQTRLECQQQHCCIPGLMTHTVLPEAFCYCCVLLESDEQAELQLVCGLAVWFLCIFSNGVNTDSLACAKAAASFAPVIPCKVLAVCQDVNQTVVASQQCTWTGSRLLSGKHTWACRQLRDSVSMTFECMSKCSATC